MMRAARLKHDPEFIDGFRQRGREVTRLEGFSDAVFGFALSSAQARASPDDQHHSLG
jgi:hypothetical protein